MIKQSVPSHAKYLRKNKLQLRELIKDKCSQLGIFFDAMKYCHWDKYSLCIELDSLSKKLELIKNGSA